ncbi:ImmA/IrrE family metallo-endopeptidase [Tepidanaerobacter syntrophicus]|uniref:ImmA/IrrE family metallo-endopeptidase n=1 Tax=Tepidanaerobacter syntrophicus TaxID=224999 RepID=UPI001BD22D94|nr:ImmA/IrrE family metallo-endopeptidase [Tepidanaerobacter syntrophicus]
MMVREIFTAMRNNQDFDNLLWAYGIICRLKTLPGYIYGFTYRSTSSIYHIFINEALCDAKRNETVLHELEHIELGHFDAGFIGIIDIYYEEQADKEAKMMINSFVLCNTKEIAIQNKRL